jgi:hypothetical protein
MIPLVICHKYYTIYLTQSMGMAHTKSFICRWIDTCCSETLLYLPW